MIKMILNCKISSVSYNNKIIVKDIKFNLDRGNCLILTGDSGSGKTTVLLAIANLLNPKESKIEATIKIKKDIKIAFVAQNPDANIISGDVKSELLLHSNGNIKQINATLTMFNISKNLLSKKIKELSSGQKQLITVISSLLHNADLYLFDEPTAMLDNENSQIVSKAIKELLKIGKTVLLSTHNPQDFDFCHQIFSLKSKPKTYQPEIFKVYNKNISEYKFVLENLDFSYNKKGNIFTNFNLSLENGDILLLSGKNGTGKTTLAKLMAGLIKPKSGTITLNGTKIKKLKNYLPIIFSYSLQNPNWNLLFDTVENEVNFCIKKYNKENASNHKNNLYKIFENTNIDSKKEPRELSFGQKKFITNLSFYHNPIIHFFDEPDLGTDKIFNQYLIDYFNYRKEYGLISIIVSHNINKYKPIATKHIILN